jgi:hypothetical protein
MKLALYNKLDICLNIAVYKEKIVSLMFKLYLISEVTVTNSFK